MGDLYRLVLWFVLFREDYRKASDIDTQEESEDVSMS
jgi:hypothetical protein